MRTPAANAASQVGSRNSLFNAALGRRNGWQALGIPQTWSVASKREHRRQPAGKTAGHLDHVDRGQSRDEKRRDHQCNPQARRMGWGWSLTVSGCHREPSLLPTLQPSAGSCCQAAIVTGPRRTARVTGEEIVSTKSILSRANISASRSMTPSP
jgi:hypothetical protein